METNRRALIGATAALAGATALNAVVAKAATVGQFGQPDAPDAELRVLWAEYQKVLSTYTTALREWRPRRDAYVRDMAPYYADGAVWKRLKGLRNGWTEWQKQQKAAARRFERKHKTAALWKTMNRCSGRAEKIRARILASEATSLFGVGVKLAAMPMSVQSPEKEDYVDTLRSLLPDIDKLSAGSFSAALAPLEDYE